MARIYPGDRTASCASNVVTSGNDSDTNETSSGFQSDTTRPVTVTVLGSTSASAVAEVGIGEFCGGTGVIQYWNGSSWINVAGTSVSANASNGNSVSNSTSGPYTINWSPSLDLTDLKLRCSTTAVASGVAGSQGDGAATVTDWYANIEHAAITLG